MEQNGRGAQMLAAVFDDRIKERSAGGQENQLSFDFAEVLADYSLRPNTFPAAIPLKDYTACQNAGKHHYGCRECIDTGQKHCGWEAPPPPQIKPGDRVLIAWVHSQPVLIDVVTRGEFIVKGKQGDGRR
ncbi:MAG: hypothetical protein HFH59_09210 [Lachnospiraceae bacterium]|nr:hypothetical protein [Lachnospiraceae bacterium]MCI9357701.1 hypothetical protein [Lachnospiraceae bacterium]